MLSEREMEDQIAADPTRFLEQNLALVARQFRIGTYVFDLLFEDRHGGKLIIEIQKGTLDRNHTYKILDYYHEYRERHPTEFIDLMVVANQITMERKKRLTDLGIAYRELPESLFELNTSPSIIKHTPNAPVVPPPTQSSDPPYNIELPTVSRTRSASLGVSGIIVASREALRHRLDGNRWGLSTGDASLKAKHMSTTNVVHAKLPNSAAQIWMERPKQGKVICKFELATHPTNHSTEYISGREDVARSLRSFLVGQRLPEGVVGASKSTVVKLPTAVPLISGEKDDTPENALRYQSVIDRIVEFAMFLDSALPTWVERWAR